MWRIFYRPAPGDNAESDVIAEASNRLDVGEFQLFQLGYEHWFGARPAPGRIEADFLAYMARNDPPPWARHFARRIIALDERGALHGDDPAYHRFDRVSRAPPKWTGWSVIGLTLAVVALFLWLIIMAEATEAPARCLFPPCP